MSLKPPIFVVSGLPRSGTSLMMQILAAGGIQPLADQCRAADASNPNGYFEFEPVKRLARDASWMDQAVGKAIKIISPLLQFLPDSQSYRVIFIDRSLDEVLASQARMLGKVETSSQTAQLKQAFLRQNQQALDLLKQRPGFSGIVVEHRQLLANPSLVVHQICEFLQPMELKMAAMVQVIEPSLYRCREK